MNAQLSSRPLTTIRLRINCLILMLLLIISANGMPPSQGGILLSGQNDQPAIILNVELVVLHPVVQDRKRNAVSGLVKEDFKVYEDGIIQQIESFDHADIPVTVGLVIDNSGTMRSKQHEVITAGLAFARACNAEDELFVVNFNEYVSLGLPSKIPFTNQPAQLELALTKVATGKTALYDAIAVALNHLKQGNRDKKVLIVISDGGDNASKLTLAQTIAMVKQSDAIIYTIGLFDEGDPDRNPGVLKQLATVTGGEVFLPKLISEVGPICQQISQDFRNQYTITYSPQNIKLDGTYRVIKVTAANGHRQMNVRARAGYNAPLQP